MPLGGLALPSRPHILELLRPIYETPAGMPIMMVAVPFLIIHYDYLAVSLPLYLMATSCFSFLAIVACAFQNPS